MVKKITPQKIRLEAATVCQLQCPSCSTTQGIIKKNLGGGFLKFKDFQRLVDENPWVSHIELSNNGEIFLNSELIKIIEYAHKKNISLTASNGVNLNTVSENVLESLVKYKFKHMTCSIDGASEETYKIYRRRGNFDTVIENIKKINHYKSLYQSKFPLLTWQFIAFGHNEHEISKARDMAKDLNMKFFLKFSYDELFSPVKNEQLVRKETESEVATSSEYIQKHGRNQLQTHICSQLWNQPQINWDGRVLGCCVNNWGDFGNAFDSSLIKELNNEKIHHARQMLLGKEEAREDIPCTSCSYYKIMQKHNSWLTINEIKNPENLHWLRRMRASAWTGRLGRLKVWIINTFRSRSI
jgi:MoaA/NifB/PqqE/SkfB family radical SAM enzyme